MTITENIQRDLNKAKARITNIDIEIAVLQKERVLMDEKAWELGFYLDEMEKENENEEIDNQRHCSRY